MPNNVTKLQSRLDRLLILVPEESHLWLLTEIRCITDNVACSTVVEVPAEILTNNRSHGLLRSLAAPFRRMSLKAWLDKHVLTEGGTLILNYCDSEEFHSSLSGHCSGLGLKVLARRDLGLPFGCFTLPRVTRHFAAERTLTLAEFGSSELSRVMVEALRVARPESEINLVHIDDENLSHLSTDGIDWFLCFNPSVADSAVYALAAGIPVLSSLPQSCHPCDIASYLDDESALLFAPDLTKEEFVRGLLPFIESDFRSSAMSDGALRCWAAHFDLQSLFPKLISRIMEKC